MTNECWLGKAKKIFFDIAPAIGILLVVVFVIGTMATAINDWSNEIEEREIKQKQECQTTKLEGYIKSVSPEVLTLDEGHQVRYKFDSPILPMVGDKIRICNRDHVHWERQNGR